MGDKGEWHIGVVHLARDERGAAGTAIAAAALELDPMAMALQGFQHAFAGMSVQHAIPGMYPWCLSRLLFGRRVRGRG